MVLFDLLADQLVLFDLDELVKIFAIETVVANAERLLLDIDIL